MYSQNQEETYIVNYFGSKKGNFLDIGGYHPFKFSNTRKLYEFGWSGIYIEPSPVCFKNFIQEYENELKITLINKAVVTDGSKTISFWDSNGDAVSTSNLEHKDKWEKSGAKYNLIEVEAISTKEVEELCKIKIDFLSLDVESNNINIFNALSDSFLFGLDMLCIEHDNHFDTIINRMVGFKIIHQNGENLILAK